MTIRLHWRVPSLNGKGGVVVVVLPDGRFLPEWLGVWIKKVDNIGNDGGDIQGYMRFYPDLETLQDILCCSTRWVIVLINSYFFFESK